MTASYAPRRSDERTPLLVSHTPYHSTNPHSSTLYSTLSSSCPTSPLPSRDDDNTPLIYSIPPRLSTSELQGYYDDDPPPYYEAEERQDLLPTYGEVVPPAANFSEFEEDDWMERWGGYFFSAFFVLMFAGATLVALLPLGFSSPDSPSLPSDLPFHATAPLSNNPDVSAIIAQVPRLSESSSSSVHPLASVQSVTETDSGSAELDLREADPSVRLLRRRKERIRQRTE
ncbi:uncharacterized protein SPPG_07872 [Spizellomyces punctatus DAOM BR117]|uniref:Uncharacterized protein n=1 Tax=Spizellomyces punctatus (strain DAOM BR117) TaxID=645134 RepID=A0A0L0H6R7_SPIPD|nr:uncharacterized protein SPPG_07872 [Spizellomyces punctatus DAOM BR117]KNC96659.1 hypothetical protein SPPG_07872 [Spizellomyces punctatus DAOM BR117]|eukprot:XP_016604699.1 hypothetical protein SPPG_07872 [Spizellomyces punctatus DAOM BR117]